MEPSSDNSSKPEVRKGQGDRRIYFFALIVLITGALMTASGTSSKPGDRFWREVQPLCGKAFEGRLVEGTESSDAEIGAKRLVMHVRDCSDQEIRIPFHVGDNRSRTWVLSRTETGIRLKHDHRHEDGTEDEITQYGGESAPEQDSFMLEFPADEFTGKLIPAARTNIWTMKIDPGKVFTYALRREESGRRFRVDFDLTRTVPVPPPAW